MLQSREQSAPFTFSASDPRPAASDRERAANPDARGLVARIVGLYHGALSGLTGVVSRGPKPWQLCLAGKRPITLLDIAEIACHPSRETRAVTTDVALLLLDQVRPADGTLPGESVSTLLREATEAAGAYAKAMDDGTLTVAECDRVLAELADLDRAMGVARAAFEARRRKLSA